MFAQLTKQTMRLDWTEQAYAFSRVVNDHVWIGLDKMKLNMRTAFWSDGNQMNMHNWAAVPVDPDTTSCAYIDGTDGKWYLDNCMAKKFYACKISNGRMGGTHKWAWGGLIWGIIPLIHGQRGRG